MPFWLILANNSTLYQTRYYDDIIVKMETIEQATRKSKLSDTAIGKSPLRSMRLQMVQRYRGRRDYSDSADSDVDNISVYGEYSVDFESDESAQFSDPDFQQKISSLESQLARLKTSVEKSV